MLSLSSNCCRVDAVKASADQLKLQLAQRRSDANNAAERAANQQLLSVDAQIKSGDATKAELALTNAKAAITQAQAQDNSTYSPANLKATKAQYGSVDVRV